MSYLVDTNVFSEPVRPEPGANVVAWLRANESSLYVSTITIGEMRRGIERLPSGRRRTQLRSWLVALCDCMKGRVLSYNTSTAHVWGQLKANWDAAGIVIPSLDSQNRRDRSATSTDGGHAEYHRFRKSRRKIARSIRIPNRPSLSSRMSPKSD